MIVVDRFHTVLVEHNEDLTIAIGGDHAITSMLLVRSLLLQAQALTNLYQTIFLVAHICIYQPHDIMI